MKKCDQILSISSKFRREMEVFYADKKKIQNEIDVFNNDPPATLKRSQIDSVLRNLKKLQIKRNILNSREQSFFDEIQSLRNLKTTYIRQLAQKEGNIDYQLIKNSEMNLSDKVGMMLSELEFINTERSLIAKEFHRLSSVPQPFGLEGINLDNLPPLDIKDSLDRLIEYRDENRDHLKKKKPKLLTEIDNIILYLQDGSMGKKYDAGRTVRDIVNTRLKEERKRKKEKRKKRLKKLGIEFKEGKPIIDLNGEFKGDFDQFYQESEAMQAFFENHDDYIMQDMINISKKVNHNVGRLQKYEMMVQLDRNLNNQERVNRKILQLERERAEFRVESYGFVQDQKDRELRKNRVDVIENMKSMLRRQRETLMMVYEAKERAERLRMAPMTVKRI